MTITQQEKLEAVESLRKLIKPGDTVFTVLRHCSSSGMYRAIDMYLIRENEPRRISFTAARAIERRYDKKHEAVSATGCGMDMGFELVYNLGRVLFPKGFPVVEPCDKCQDRPGFNGLGKPCKTCKGIGMKPARGRNGDMTMTAVMPSGSNGFKKGA